MAEIAYTWPPDLDLLKLDLRKSNSSTATARDDALQLVLDAAVAFVEGVRADDFDFADDLESPLPDPAGSPDLILGTVRLAGRWHTRRRSPDGLIEMAGQGASRVSSGDVDIDRLLRIGQHARPRVG